MKYFAYIIKYIDRIPMMKTLPETVKLSVIASFGVFVWLLSGFLVPSGPALEVPSSISEKNKNTASVKVVSKTINPEDFNEILSFRGYTQAKRSVSIASETSGIIEVALLSKKGRKSRKTS